MSTLQFRPYKDAKKRDEGFFEQKFIVLQFGPCDSREFEHYERYGLPRSPERLELPILADRYIIGPELTQRDVYYALCLEKDIRDRHYADRISELSKKLPISKKDVLKATPKSDGKEIVSLEILL